MKRILSLVLSVLLVATMLCACGDTTNTTAAPGNNPDPTDAPTNAPSGDNGTKVITVADYLADASKWENDGGEVSVSADGVHFDNFFYGDSAALRLKEVAQNVTYKFTVQLNQIPELTPDTMWDAELQILGRSQLAAPAWEKGQTGYCLTAWGDMSEVYIGRSGHDDAFGNFKWNVNDGQPHEIEFSIINNEDGTVNVILVVDGSEIANITDDGTAQKNGAATPMFLNEGGLTVRCQYLDVIIK